MNEYASSSTAAEAPVGQLCFTWPVNRSGVPTGAGNTTIQIRPRDESDLAECVQVLRAVHDGSGYPMHWPDRPGGWLTPPFLLTAWVAELAGQVVGHIGLSRGGAGDAAPLLWTRRAGVPVADTAVVSRLFVAPAARGHGIGASLLARAVLDARERALHPVLDVLVSDTSAVALYERLGWSLLGTVQQRWSPNQTVAVHCYAAPA